jgi:hypothetical protein
MTTRRAISFKSTGILAGIIIASCLSASCGDKGAPNAKLPIGSIDVPQPGQTITAHVNAVGWAIAEDRVADVSVFVDRAFWKKCTINGSRPDVRKVYPGFPEGDNSGWTVDLDASALPEGKHELLFQARSSKGSVRDLGSMSVIIAR